ncbi:MAG TPA: HEAT repeat domain-containing protein [Planctomycetota bacterium]|nr:HEAT repeat domain-containing protein [Planctomycetota bacterium]
MNRNALLVILVLFGAGAVGGLLFLTGGKPDERSATRATREAPGDPRTEPTSQAGPKKGVQHVTPEMARNRGELPQMALPGAREPFDSPEMIEARERYAGRIEELVKGMTDPKLRPDERMAMARELQDLLRKMGHRVTPQVRERLLQMLGAAQPAWKDAIAGAIGSLDGDTDTAQALLNMLRNTPDDISTRRAIYSALGMMNVPDVTPSLLAMLGEGLQDEPLIIRTIGQVARPEELEQLFVRLDKPLIPASRTEIERVLQERGRIPGLMDQVAKGLDDADIQKRRSLLRILQASTDPKHAELVRSLLRTETDSESRAIAIQGLGKYGDVESGRMLLEIVQSGSPEDQSRAINAIHSIRDRDTVALLAKNFEGLGPEGRLAIMGAISRIPAPTDEMTKVAQERGLQDPELRVRTAAARTLGQRGRDDGVEALVAYIERSDQRGEWSTAFLALEKIHTAKAAAAAIRVLRVVPNDRERERLEEQFKKIIEESR